MKPPFGFARIVCALTFFLAIESFGQSTFWQATSGPGGGSVDALACNSAGDAFAGTGGTGIYRSTDDGGSWTQVNSGLTNTLVLTLAIDSAGFIYAGTSGGGVFRSTNNGGSWSAVNNGLSNLGILSLFAAPGSALYAGTNGGGVFRTTDGGANWSNILPSSGATHVAVNSNSVIFVGLKDPCCRGIIRSTDGGASWVSGLSVSSDPRSLAVADSVVYFGSNAHGAFRSENGGANWTTVSSGLVNTTVISFAVRGAGELFAGTGNGGVWRSTNRGDSWSWLDSGAVDPYARALAVNSRKFVFAGTNSLVYRSAQPLTSVEWVVKPATLNLSLMQNYPNPFNPATTISFSLPLRSFASLKVFDALGREVSILSSEELSPGKHSRQWNAEGLPSAVYFYRLQAGSFSETKKLILLR